MIENSKIDLRLGDCLEIMRGIPDKSVDAVITDPPYGISRENNFASMPRYYAYKGIDFGEWDKGFNQLAWIEPALKKLKQDANVVIFNSWENLGNLKIELERLGFSVKRPIVLKKVNPMPHNRDRLFVNTFEFGVWAARGKWVFNRFGKYNQAYFETTNNGETEHPTEKHYPTIKSIVEILTDEGQTVLDCFLGSGTTGVACVKLNRNFIGIEINPDYFAIAQRRITEAKAQMRMF